MTYFWHVRECNIDEINDLFRFNARKAVMDSQVARDGRLMELVDEKWRDDKLPMEEVAVPQMELPEIEPDNGPTNETLKEQEQKWSDLALSALHDQPPATTNN